MTLLEEKYNNLLNLNACLKPRFSACVRRETFKVPMLFLIETMDSYTIRIPVTNDSNMITCLVEISDDADDFRKHVYELYPCIVNNIMQARHETNVYTSVVARLKEINKDHVSYISKFIAVHGLLPLFGMLSNIGALWNTFCENPEQLPFSFAAIKTCICKEDRDFHWNHNWKESCARNFPEKIKEHKHPLDMLNDWIEPMGLSFRNGAFCLCLSSFTNDYTHCGAAVFLTSDPVVALKFLGIPKYSGSDRSKVKAICSSRYFSPNVLRARTHLKFSTIATPLQKYVLYTYPDIYEKEACIATPDQLKQLTDLMKKRSFKHFSRSESMYETVCLEIKMFNTLEKLHARNEIDEFEKKYESVVSFDVRMAVISRFYEFIFLYGLEPLYSCELDELKMKWYTFRDQLLENKLAPHDWIAARSR